MVPLTDPEVTVLIVNSNVKHELTGGEYAERRSQCEAAAKKIGVASLRDATLDLLGQTNQALEPVLLKRARHVIGDIQRTTEAAEGLESGDWRRVGELMYASHESLRDDYEVSCEELDLLVELAKEQGPSGGVIGSRMTGGGFGGCVIALLSRERTQTAIDAVESQYEARTGNKPRVFRTKPARGLQAIKQPQE